MAFSAGVDSTFLLKAAHMALGDGAIALTALHRGSSREILMPRKHLPRA